MTQRDDAFGMWIFALVIFLALASLYVALVYLWAFGAAQGFVDLPLGVTSSFVLIHLPAAGAGLWLWMRVPMQGPRAYAIRAATIYFIGAVLFAMAGNLLLSSIARYL